MNKTCQTRGWHLFNAIISSKLKIIHKEVSSSNFHKNLSIFFKKFLQGFLFCGEYKDNSTEASETEKTNKFSFSDF